MKLIPSDTGDVKLIELQRHRDSRGWFMESWNQRDCAALGIEAQFVQTSHSFSERHVLRGLHYQLGVAQAKLVQVLAGEIFDVVVDMRSASPHYGRWYGFNLRATAAQLLWVPGGFAHGFLVCSATAEVMYQSTALWSKEDERVLAWNDPTLAIAWPLNGTPLLSEKDQQGTLFVNAEACS